MNSELEQWFSLNRKKVEKLGCRIVYKDGWIQGSGSVDIDCEKFVGTLTCWPGGRFEVQFNSNLTGGIIVLEERNLQDQNDFSQYFWGNIWPKLFPM